MNIVSLQAIKVKEMIENGQFDLIIDLRIEENYSEGHLPGAINIPINQIIDKIDFLEEYKNKSILLYCAIGTKSKSTCKVLALNGFDKLYTLSRGLKDYKFDLE